MKISKCFVIFGLCILLGSCPLANSFDIDIGDYEYHLASWDRQNLSDYQLLLVYWPISYFYNTEWSFISVKNGIPEICEPPEWLAGGKMSTVPEVFSFVKEEEKRLRDRNSRLSGHSYFIVRYDFEYHYPNSIEYTYNKAGSDRTPDWRWYILMMPLVENEQEAWNSQDMLDYKLSLDYSYDGRSVRAVISVKNGIPESSDPPEWLAGGKMSTVPEVFSFVKEEEKRLENVRATREGYFRVIYDPVYHYPSHISTRNHGLPISYENTYAWNIVLTPLGEE
jgi:hypothetical protein